MSYNINISIQWNTIQYTWFAVVVSSVNKPGFAYTNVSIRTRRIPNKLTRVLYLCTVWSEDFKRNHIN